MYFWLSQLSGPEKLRAAIRVHINVQIKRLELFDSVAQVWGGSSQDYFAVFINTCCLRQVFLAGWGLTKEKP